MPLGAGHGICRHIQQPAGTGNACRAADLLSGRYRPNSTLYPAVHPAAVGAVFTAAFNAVRPVGAAAAGLGHPAQPEPCRAAISLCGIPPRAAGAGGRGVPRLPRREERRPQGRHPRLLSGAYRHRQDHERALPCPESHGRGLRRKAVLPDRPQHHPSRRRGRSSAAACRAARSCPAQRDPDRQGKGLSAPGRRRSPRLSAGGVPLCQRLLRPPQGCAGGSAGRQRQLQPRCAGRHRPAVLGVSL